MRLKPWIRRIHLWLAFVSSLPLLVMAVTGALLVFPTETEDLFSPADLRIESSGPMLLPTEFIDRVESQLPPGDRVVRLQYPEQPHCPMEVDTRQGRILANPLTGDVLQATARRGGFMRIVLGLHVSLLMGEAGTQVTGICASCLMLLIASGWWLWWPAGRWNRSYFGIALHKGWKRINFDLHRATGLYLGLVLFLMALTGATMVYWRVFTAPVYWFTGSTYVENRYQIKVEPKPIERISPDEALQIALATYPGLEPRRLYLPQEATKPYRVFLDPPGEHEFRVNEVRLELDPFTGEILQAESPETMSRADRLLQWVLPLHFGTFGGTWSRWLYFVVSLSPLLLSVTGTILWWNRHRKQKRATSREREMV